MPSVEMLIVLASLIFVHIAGHFGSRRGKKDFVLAERSLSLPLLVSTLVATWYGAVLASGEFVMRYGVVFLLCFGVPYYIVAGLYAKYMPGWIRGFSSASIPEQLGTVFGPSARRVAAVLLLIVTIPASYQLMLGHLIGQLFGIDIPLSIVLGTTLSLAYVAVGGLRSDAYANVLQLALMYGGMILLVAASVLAFGSPKVLITSATSPLFQIPGALGWAGISAWWIISLQTFIDPNFYVRTASATSENAARKAILLSILCWIVFDVLQLISGLYAARFLPESQSTVSYVALASVVLPSWGQGIVYAGIIAAVSSTLNGYALVSATTFTDDFLSVVVPSSSRWPVRYQLGLVITALIGGCIAVVIPSFVEIILYASSIVVSALLLPLIVSYSQFSGHVRSHIIPIMILPALMALASIVTNVGEPALIGTSASILLHLAVWIKRKKST